MQRFFECNLQSTSTLKDRIIYIYIYIYIYIFGNLQLKKFWQKYFQKNTKNLLTRSEMNKHKQVFLIMLTFLDNLSQTFFYSLFRNSLDILKIKNTLWDKLIF